jgi:D-3-phosphoglycerate dehydrogenase
MKKILITEPVHALLPEGLTKAGFQVDWLPDITEAGVHEVVHLYTGLVINSKVYCGKELMDKGAQLKFIARCGSGLEVMDLDYATIKDITCLNSPEGNSNAVAEQALGMLLNIMNNMSRADNEVRQDIWSREPNRGVELQGKTVGLIAYGHTARAFAKLLSVFGCRVLAYDKYKKDFGDEYATAASMEQIAAAADILSIHLPLTKETKGMIGYNYLSSFARPYYLLNTSRGVCLDTNGMLRCMAEGRIKSAALDVLENEKITSLNETEKQWFNQLTANRNILLTPHIAGWTVESKQKIASVLLQKIAALQLI